MGERKIRYAVECGHVLCLWGFFVHFSNLKEPYNLGPEFKNMLSEQCSQTSAIAFESCK